MKSLLRQTCIVLGLLVLIMNPEQVAAQATTPTIPKATIPIIPNSQAEAKDLSNSEQALEPYIKLFGQLNAKSSVSPAEVQQLKRVARQATNALPSIKRNLEAVIQKAKAADVWGRLDQLLQQEAGKLNVPSDTKAKFLNWVKQHGGAGSVLENALTELDNAQDNIADEIQNVKRKQKQTGLHFEGIPWAHAAMSLWMCAIVGAVGIGTTLGGCLACGAGAVYVMAANC